MDADSLAENAPELICPICLPKPRSSGFQWKKTWVSIDRVINLSDLVDILNLLDFADIFDHIFSLMDLSNLWDLSELQSCANTKNAFFACFRPYVGQSDTHISWVTLMPFPSIYPTDPRTNPAQFCEKILRIDGFEKCSFFESAICLLNPMASSQRFLGSKDGSEFLCLLWFPAHEVLGQHLCTGLYVVWPQINFSILLKPL